ncbi:TonB system transport protein ExbD [Citrobacter freundii complex sp. CFNIH2]|uniref:ExbD/TolR family protein n=1 Tax=Citrobacter freundii complex sp. CFNIH2 TaxID=2066049 RepID=UPI000C86A3BC|nr:biopolymer transporter ExbD [Citrobacter freundii complex sp. CFNIH2]AUO66011.1 TonB system transport protein ExbD [Citrobacter freundii complex sp. CFNIH2]
MAFSSPSSHDDDLNALSEINVTPFIDVMLVLLIIFMVAAPLSTSNLDIDLPSTSKAPQQDNAQQLIVSLRENGELFIKDQPVASGAFLAAMKTASGDNSGARIFIRADKNVSYQALMTLMDRLRDGGYSKVSLVGMESDGGAAGNAP